MKIDLNIPRGQKQRDFLDYFNAAIRGRMKNYQGSYFVEGDKFFTTISGSFGIDQTTVPLEWKIAQDPEGNIASISAEATDQIDSNIKWSEAAYEFISSVLATTLSERKQTYFRRQHFYFIGTQIDGEYWISGYRFAPLIPNDEMPSLLNAERIMVIDQNIEAIDEIQASLIASTSAARHAARLSLLLDVGLTKPEGEMRWFTSTQEDGGFSEPVRSHLGCHSSALNAGAMPKKGEMCVLGKYEGSLTTRYRVAGQLQSFPPEARRIFKGIDQAEPLITTAFDSGARLYQVALVCGRFFPSVGLAYRVAAVEAISEADAECNGFSEFMRKYVRSKTSMESVLDYLYGKARSAHFHAGAFPLGEFSEQRHFDMVKELGELGENDLQRIGFELTREAIVNWMLGHIPE